MKRACRNTALDNWLPLGMEWKPNWEDYILCLNCFVEKSPHSFLKCWGKWSMAVGSWGSRDVFITPSCCWLSHLHGWKGCNPPPNNPGLSPIYSSEMKVPPIILFGPACSSVFSASAAQVALTCFFTHHPIKFQMLNCDWWGWQALLPLHSSLGHRIRKAVTTANPSRNCFSESRQWPRSPSSPCWRSNPACFSSALLLKSKSGILWL